MGDAAGPWSESAAGTTSSRAPAAGRRAHAGPATRAGVGCDADAGQHARPGRGALRACGAGGCRRGPRAAALRAVRTGTGPGGGALRGAAGERLRRAARRGHGRGGALGAVGPRRPWRLRGQGGSRCELRGQYARRLARRRRAPGRVARRPGGLAHGHHGRVRPDRRSRARRAWRAADDPDVDPSLRVGLVPGPVRGAGGGRRRARRSAARPRRGCGEGEQRPVDADGLRGPARTDRVGVVAGPDRARRRRLRAAVDGGRVSGGRPAAGRRLARAAGAGGGAATGARRRRGAGAVRRSGRPPGTAATG